MKGALNSMTRSLFYLWIILSYYPVIFGFFLLNGRYCYPIYFYSFEFYEQTNWKNDTLFNIIIFAVLYLYYIYIRYLEKEIKNLRDGDYNIFIFKLF